MDGEHGFDSRDGQHGFDSRYGECEFMEGSYKRHVTYKEAKSAEK